ncbi:hypothetical protein BU17DRAFT_79314 [Hysterangium stoloniferum]|nr:hypothetical protein BU17DRAFT_79314 [Hysterangium stoloniferum]
MSYYYLLPLALVSIPSAVKADPFGPQICHDQDDKEISCSQHQRIIAMVVSFVALLLIILGAVIFTCVKKRRARRFASMDQPAAPQMEQGGAGQWAPPGPPMGAPTGQWASPSGVPPTYQGNQAQWAPPQYIPPNPFQDQKI